MLNPLLKFFISILRRNRSLDSICGFREREWQYEAHNKEDFVEIEIKDVSGTDYDALLAALPVYG